ncbi:AMP-binding protein [Actinomadura rudentiformis]|uniref:Fatty acyl-AMP ligase n=1 Tax=Actinomadura rudentiformis TaxID=359158 RepID=A0A6H9YBQ5_9ACTN|nr:AMP-binding protein [Actinomadura rudentiformis]KAB2342445.1 fatty acyl-AMP ligase [Actinomadura rudentiformis]
MGLLDWLEAPDESHGIRLAVPGGGWRFHSYAGLAMDVRRLAAFLRDRRVPAGTPVSLMLSNPLDFAAGFAGCLLAGLTPSPIATPLTFGGRAQYAEHVAGVLRVARPSLLLADGELYDAAAEAALSAGLADALVRLPEPADLPEPEIAGGPGRAGGAGGPQPDLALLQFTSGSSGRPKGVRVTWDNLDDNITALRAWSQWGPGDSFASWLPLYHDMGLIGGLLTPLVSQADLWLMTPDQFIRSPLRWLECFGSLGATMTTAPTFGYAYTHRRVREQEIAEMDFSGWRVAICGAERVDAAELAEFTALLRPRGFRSEALMPAYGLAEGTLGVTGVEPGVSSPVVRLDERALAPGEPVRVAETATLGVDRVKGAGWLTACGPEMRRVRVRIVDEDGTALPEGSFGEIQIGGSSMAAGYATVDGTIDFEQDGWTTGDSGFQLDGHLYVVGRIGDSLKVRGRRVHAEDLEAELARVDGISAGRCAVVFGSHHAVDVAAAVVESSGESWVEDTVARLRAATSDSVAIAVFKGRRGIIPRTSSGKTRRRFLWNALRIGTSEAEPVYVAADAEGRADLPWELTVPVPHEEAAS